MLYKLSPTSGRYGERRPTKRANRSTMEMYHHAKGLRARTKPSLHRINLNFHLSGLFLSLPSLISKCNVTLSSAIFGIILNHFIILLINDGASCQVESCVEPSSSVVFVFKRLRRNARDLPFAVVLFCEIEKHLGTRNLLTQWFSSLPFEGNWIFKSSYQRSLRCSTWTWTNEMLSRRSIFEK